MDKTPAALPSFEALPEESIVGNYFVAAYPPFSCWESSQTDLVHEVLNRPEPSQRPLGLYVHVPFCQKKCDYCYYLSFVGAPSHVVEGYLESLEMELELYAQSRGMRGRPLSFVYFGGGTPSTLTPSQVRLLAEGLQYGFPWKTAREITFECAPRSVRPDFLEALRSIGVNRLSMGVQSFDNTILKVNGRIHYSADVYRAFDLIQKAKFDWVNLDLMVGLLGETDEIWERTVDETIRLSPDSVAIYQMEIPFNTQLYRDWKANSLPAQPASWEVKRKRLDRGFQKLSQAGYSIVSAYSAVKDPDRHRFQYQESLWRGGDLLGLGVASFSYLDGIHFQNAITLETYTAQLRHGHLPLKRAFRLSERDRLVRELVLQLKWGQVSASEFENKFQTNILEEFAEPIHALAAEDLLTASSEGVRLTKNGLLQADRLLPAFYDAPFRNVRYS